MKERLEESEQLSKQNERRKFYKAVDKAKRGLQPRIMHCKTETGKVICEESEVLERWEQHFKELLNKEVEDERLERDETDVELVRKGKKERREKKKSKQTSTHLQDGKWNITFRKQKIIKHLEKII